MSMMTAILAAGTFADVLSMVLNIAYVAIGLGLVIFFHELGHFAVAKWCDVHVERFSIGFGPILWSRKKGETEYALSLIPFGGYVKMLGQDDMDPSQLSSDEIAQEPRSYSAKSVPQRMAIISAGVLMNVITAVLFFATAFGMGVEMPPAEVGNVQIGKPAWQAGIQQGDVFTRINGREIESFPDITRAVALSTGDVTIEGIRRKWKTDELETFQVTVTPDGQGTRRVVGVGPTAALRLIGENKQGIPPVIPGTPAADATPAFQPGDAIVRIGHDGEIVDLADFAHLQWIVARHREKPLDFYVSRAGGRDDELVKIAVGPNPFRTLGLWMDIGTITSVRRDSPAARAGLEPGDKIAKVDGKGVGREIDPLRLPDYFEEKAREREDVELVVSRKGDAADPRTMTVHFTPTDEPVPAWIETPSPGMKGEPMSIPALGVAYHLIPIVLKVETGSPADGKVFPNERIRKMVLALPDGAEPDHWSDDEVEIRFGEKDKSGADQQNWAHAFWLMQVLPTRTVTLTVARLDAQTEERTVTLTPAEADDWFVPLRGIRPEMTLVEQQADGVLDAVAMGFRHTSNTLFDIYRTLRNLFGGHLSVKELSGPVTIAKVAYRFTEQGISDLLLFLGFLSVNLAVLNFLPIPVLDGGHMMFLVWEAVTRRKPSERVLVAATYIGMAFVLCLMGLVLYLDIFVHRM